MVNNPEIPYHLKRTEAYHHDNAVWDWGSDIILAEGDIRRAGVQRNLIIFNCIDVGPEKQLLLTFSQEDVWAYSGVTEIELRSIALERQLHPGRWSLHSVREANKP